MRTALARMIRRTVILLLFLSILTLMLNSFLPLVISEDLDSPDNLVYFNFENMKFSENNEIKNLHQSFNLINYCLWAIIIVNLLSFFAVILKLSKEYSIIGTLFLLSGCASIVFSGISCYLYFMFINKVIALENVSLAYIITNLKFPYILLLLSFLLVLASIYYLVIILPYLIKSIKNNEETKQPIKNEKAYTTTKKKKQDTESEFENKRDVTEEWKTKEIKQVEVDEKDDIKIEEEPVKEEKIVEDAEQKEIQFDSTNQKSSPFSDVPVDEKPKKDSAEEVKPSDSFEKALFSAIDKKRKNEPLPKESKKEEPVKKTDKNPAVKKYNVKCPECSFVFSADRKEGEATKIKCPRCGKEGVIK